jgi:catechol 2,3-dioxygenase-like lactoylglutathione lyase family enzyme
MTMVTLFQITPFLLVPDMEQALDLFTRVLRFEVKWSMSNYRYLEWGEVALRILEEPSCAAADADRDRVAAYIDVSDVDALYAELLPELKTLPRGDVRAPINQTWKQREFQVRLPDGRWLAFGQPVREEPRG